MAETKKGVHVVLTVVGIILCIIFGLMLITNVTIIIKGVITPDSPPSIFGVTPMVVQSGSMSIWNDADDRAAGNVIHKVFPEEIADLSESQIAALGAGDKMWSYEEDYMVENEIVAVIDKGDDGMWYNTIRLADDHIEVGDLIFIKKADPQDLKVGDVISFLEDSVVVTHRIIRVETAEDGTLQFITKGDANLSKDQEPVKADHVIGIYFYRIAKVGDFAYFLQKPLGMLLFIGVPLFAFIIYDIIRRQKSAQKVGAKDEQLREQQEEMARKTAEMEAELERLRKLTQEQPVSEEPDAPPSDDSV